MQTTIEMETTVLPGHRVTDPKLPEGAKVQVIVVLPEKLPRQFSSALEFLQSLPPGPSPRCFPTWEEYEKFLREEKESWDR
jgi:hypothetical protein